MRLSELKTGEKGVIVKVMGRGGFRKRIIEMGFIRGKEVEVIQNAPLKDPIHYKVMGYDVSLRRSEATLIEIIHVPEIEKEQLPAKGEKRNFDSFVTASSDDLHSIAIEKGKTINVALVGNPNSGKTTLFNHASGAHEHVGNYSGVTVDAKDAVFKQHGYTFRIVDLPGTYSLSAYSPEERFVRSHLSEEHPDVVINVVDASNLERNLYLTTQLIDMDVRMVIALNMYDSLQKRGDTFDILMLEKLIGTPIIPTVSKTGMGITELFDRVIKVYEEKEPAIRHIHINYGDDLEKAITNVRDALRKNGNLSKGISKRHVAMKLLEGDPEMNAFIREIPKGEKVLQVRDENVTQIESLLEEDAETAFTNARYGFISGALRETYEPGKIESMKSTQIIDLFVTNKVLGFPIFLFFMWIMFEATFSLGAYPQDWIESLVAWIGHTVRQFMPEGPFKDLLVDGIITGVGGVIVFLPNILILYLFISFMEDSGYMARAAFIMDKIMHKMGLHGKSFIPLVMGFGCNVPAIMASRTIESRNSRMITMLINPLMSCSARLPVYVLLAGAFFPGKASFVLFTLYGTGVLLAVIMARLFKRYLFNEEDMPFVMELPPYRMPTLKSILIHMWEKARQYLKKMGGVILVASIIIWFLGYFPLHSTNEQTFDAQISEWEKAEGVTQAEKTEAILELEHQKAIDHQQNSYIGRLGQTIQPVLAPLGFDWKISVSLLTGMAAKEVVVSTLSVLYTGEDELEGEEDNQALSNRLKQDTYADGTPVFTPLVALSLMLFVLIYFPCIATITAISKEAGSWKWGLFVIGYTCLLAWLVSFIVYQAGTFFLSLSAV
ncbi:ferrous iron transport protein B [Parabacteroides sp. PF5-5]|uniref:ferrous iron transport protein B n=1 Tax=unclassified Parabacteroides TaxID=2649774 RepID=UPI00247515A6|nr:MULTISPECIES: ferrous iron transport protein B [unclassified Parabacteroides]MDH6306220.1 ferrous iron transport protein B [Parabacteroides sp. PH5-39]MDH6317179.1 ferrous iron transport protein B [Parabacteroides sp. PF5-13]MDH6320932.1 ferrous iron transport protein B [Parabacteroides sp. PH5-13]MDH6324663.1 ferrous iron transport protein B [Parabacteroides sp. PH5-8]MDH6328286.1 ferrous iron transport protein B [Parabacteroides sp. PH5-41]